MSSTIAEAPSHGTILRQLEGLIIEAWKQLRAFEEGRSMYFAYTDELRNRMQHCLADAGNHGRDELHQIATIDFNPSEGLRCYYQKRVFNDFEAPGDTEFVRLQQEYDRDTPPKIKRMIALLNQVRNKMLGIGPADRWTRMIKPFPTPDGSTWADVLIRFTSDHQVQINIRDVGEVRTYIEMGFEDKRGKGKTKPDRNWGYLRKFAEFKGTIRSTNEAHEWSKLERAVYTINMRLRASFGLADPPIVYDRMAKSYKAKPRLIPPPDNGDT
jgi:hypothetical protein